MRLCGKAHTVMHRGGHQRITKSHNTHRCHVYASNHWAFSRRDQQ
jgi:hypothetical protein